MRSYAVSGLLALLCAACSNRALTRGALSPEERREYVEQTGALIPQGLKEDFMAGRATPSMSKEMIVFLFGQPDRTEVDHYGVAWEGMANPQGSDMNDSIWDYFGPDSVSIKRGLVFKGDTVVRVTGRAAK